MGFIRELTKENYPPLLKEIPDAPERLYARGTIPSFEKKWLAIVGSRKYSSYGKDVCQNLIQNLTGAPIVIVSGLALGIDSIAHKSAIQAGLETVAIPGSGLDDTVIYPRSHIGLAREIEEKGALISELEPTQPATPWTFPKRNRIMAGISHATLVIEAEEKSGTLITSRLATEYNRDVLTVPGSIFSSTSKGPHMLIRLGATPVRNAGDILDALDIKQEKELRNYQDCSPEEKQILKLLHKPQPKDELCEQIDKPIHEINILISKLELKGHIQESGGLIKKI